MADGNVIEVVFRAVLDKLNAGVDQAKAKVSESVNSIKDSVSQANASVASSSAAIAKSMDRVGAAATKAGRSFRNIGSEMGDMKKVQSILDQTVTSVEELAAADAALERLNKANMISAEDYSDAIAKQSVLMELLEKAKLKDAAASGIQDVAQKKAAISAGELRTRLSSMATNAALGQWEGFTSATGTLGIRFATVSASAAAAAAAIAAVVAVVATLVIGFIAGQNETAEFNRALMASGNYANTTAQEMRGLAAAVAGGSVTVSNASDAILKMVASGKLNNEQLQLGAAFAADYARITGKSMTEAADKIIALREDPKRAIEEIDGAMNILTVSQYDYITSLEKTEGKAAATDAALKILADNSRPRAESLADDAGIVERAWNGVKRAVDAAKKAILDIGRSKSQVEELQAKVASIQDSASRRTARFGLGMTDGERQQIAGLNAQIEALQRTEAATSKAKAANDARQRAGKAALAVIDSEHIALDASAAKQERLITLQRAYRDLRNADPGNKRLEGVQFGSDGMPITGGQFGADMASMYESDAPKQERKKGGDPEAAARRARMEAAREEMTQLAIQRDATEQVGQARIAMDEKIVARAKALYGENSSEYRSALNQMASDQRAFEQEKQALDSVGVELQRTLGDMEREEKQRQAQNDYANGRITASQLLEVEQQLVADKLAAQRDYYERKAAMAEANGDSVGAAQAMAAVKVAEEQAMLDARQNEEAFQSESAARWQAWGDMIAGSMAQLANNLIFSGMSWRDAFVNVLGGLLNTFIGFCSNMLSKWIATKFAEVAATVSSNTAKVASDKMAAKESILANAGAAIKKIIANAAETFTSVYKAIAGIPYVGPFLAPVMAVAAGATVIGMVSKVASAERGWERVPADGMMTELHKDEQVLPAEYAEGLRNLVQQGGSGGPSITIQALDARSVKRLFQDNADVLGGVLGEMGGNFRFEG